MTRSAGGGIPLPNSPSSPEIQSSAIEYNQVITYKKKEDSRTWTSPLRGGTWPFCSLPAATLSLCAGVWLTTRPQALHAAALVRCHPRPCPATSALPPAAAQPPPPSQPPPQATPGTPRPPSPPGDLAGPSTRRYLVLLLRGLSHGRGPQASPWRTISISKAPDGRRWRTPLTTAGCVPTCGPHE